MSKKKNNDTPNATILRNLLRKANNLLSTTGRGISSLINRQPN